jgi:small subunit ribosomal protein S17
MALSNKKRAERKTIGITAVPPSGRCDDEKCPWHGKLSVRGRVFQGKVTSIKGVKTAIVKWPYTFFIPKYERYERRHSRVVAYRPECIVLEVGDTVKIIECRSLSKTKSFVVVEKIVEKK